MTPVYCAGCGKPLEIPDGFTRSKMRCADCGVFTNLPKATASRKRDPEPDDPPPKKPAKAPAPIEDEEVPVAPRPRRKPRPVEDDDDDDSSPIPIKAEPLPPPVVAKPAEPERELLIQGTEDDDGNPYQVTGDVATKRCPDCDKKIEKTARVCVHCGFDYESKQKKERSFQPVHEEWQTGFPFQTRVSIFAAAQVINFLLLMATLFLSSSGGSFTLVVLSVVMQAFLIGTYQRLNLDRTQKGKVTVTTTWRYAFIARPTETMRWKEHDSVGIKREGEFNLVEWVFVLILLAYGIVPGVLFWYYVVRPDKFTVILCADHGSTATPIFRTTNEELAKQVQRTVSDVTTLPLQK